MSSPSFLPPFDDGSSDPIGVPGQFPFGSQLFTSIFVRCRIMFLAIILSDSDIRWNLY